MLASLLVTLTVAISLVLVLLLLPALLLGRFLPGATGETDGWDDLFPEPPPNLFGGDVLAVRRIGA
jgi:hypothetical protein